jgi:hypothetical protein
VNYSASYLANYFGSTLANYSGMSWKFILGSILHIYWCIQYRLVPCELFRLLPYKLFRLHPCKLFRHVLKNYSWLDLVHRYWSIPHRYAHNLVFYKVIGWYHFRPGIIYNYLSGYDLAIIPDSHWISPCKIFASDLANYSGPGPKKYSAARTGLLLFWEKTNYSWFYVSLYFEVTFYMIFELLW